MLLAYRAVNLLKVCLFMFMKTHRDRRWAKVENHTFSCRQELIPTHDSDGASPPKLEEARHQLSSASQARRWMTVRLDMRQAVELPAARLLFSISAALLRPS